MSDLKQKAKLISSPWPNQMPDGTIISHTGFVDKRKRMLHLYEFHNPEGVIIEQGKTTFFLFESEFQFI